MDNALKDALRLATEPPDEVTVDALADLTLDDPNLAWDIARTAEHLGITAHTLRYYERIGMLTVARDPAGHRRYDARAVRRLVFITRMRTAGMPVTDLQHYLHLVDAGPATVPERLEVMLEHRDTLHRRIAGLQLALAATEYKIATYQEGPQP